MKKTKTLSLVLITAALATSQLGSSACIYKSDNIHAVTLPEANWKEAFITEIVYRRDSLNHHSSGTASQQSTHRGGFGYHGVNHGTAS